MLTLGSLHLVHCTVLILICWFVSKVSLYKRRDEPPTTGPFGKPTPYVPSIFYLFIYGKLKKGEENHYWLQNPENGLSKFIGRGQTVLKYPMTVGKYKTPILMNTPGQGHKITGEIYLVDTFMLRNLDMLEGLPVFNSRKLDVLRVFSVEQPKGKEVLCWMYYARVKTMNMAGLPLISEYSSKNISGYS